jgi:benzoate-CoA ligase family protein
VVHTHEHIYWASELFGIGTQGITADDVILCPPKMFFAFGLGNQVYFPLRAAAQVVVEPDPMRPETMLALLVAHRPTIVVAVPTLYAGVVNLMRAMEPDAVRRACDRLRLCVSGGEVLAPSLLRAWQELTGAEILDGVGTTEMTHMFLINRPGAVVDGSCGRLVDGYSARIVDESWRDVPEGEVGNLFVAGPTAAASYWNKPEKTAATMRDGGVLTGDKVRRDAAGNYFYVGRNDDMLRVGGIWVSPAEIEAALAEHDAVLECAVVGVPDENRLVKPKAYVVLRPGTAASPALGEDMRAGLRQRLAHFKCPRWIDFVPALPKTATGKIQRFKLREAAATALAS